MKGWETTQIQGQVGDESKHIGRGAFGARCAEDLHEEHARLQRTDDVGRPQHKLGVVQRSTEPKQVLTMVDEQADDVGPVLR